MSTTPAAMAAEALERLGQPAADNPTAQLFAFADEVSSRIHTIRELIAVTGEPPADPEQYRRLRDALLIAHIAGVHVVEALEADAVAQMYATPAGAKTDGVA